MPKTDLRLPAVKIRESRIGSITAFGGTASELLEGSDKGIMDKSRGFSQCAGCSTSMAACMTMLVEDGVVISHGPVGCTACLHEFAFTYRVNYPLRGKEEPSRRRLYSTDLKEEDTVFGGNAKLAGAIREAYARSEPNVIFVITTCASGIIGDDVEGVCGDAEAELGVPVVAVFCEGFRSKVWTTGFDAAYHGIARKLIAKPEARRDDLINVINFWGSDIFTEWFAPFGAKPNFITPYSSVSSLRQAGSAAATIQACSTLGSYLSAVLEQDFGVPEVPAAPPYGIKQTDRWFKALGKTLNKPDVAEKVIKAKRKEHLPRIAELRSKLEGRTVYVTGGAGHGHALLAITGELGMRPLGTSVFHHDPVCDSGRAAKDQLRCRVKDFGEVPNFNVCSKQEHELVNSLSRLKPDILLARHGGMTRCGAKLGIPSLLVGDEHFSMGYEGIVNYGERILETIENDEFVRNLARHAKSPYTRWWLDQRPSYFHEGGEE